MTITTMAITTIVIVYSGMACGFGSMVLVTPPMATIVIGCAVRPSSLEARIGGIVTTPASATITTEPELGSGSKALVLGRGLCAVS